jgi:ketosteroid isomerase-like protein
MQTRWRAVFVACVAGLTACSAGTETPERIREDLFAIERRSHQQWLHGDNAALRDLMADSFRFIAMNGAVETKEEVVGGGRDGSPPLQRPLQIASLQVEPETMTLHGDAAAVISLLTMDATVAGRPLPGQMRILSVFVRGDPGGRWRLVARSITPILGAPEAGAT